MNTRNVQRNNETMVVAAWRKMIKSLFLTQCQIHGFNSFRFLIFSCLRSLRRSSLNMQRSVWLRNLCGIFPEFLALQTAFHDSFHALCVDWNLVNRVEAKTIALCALFQRYFPLNRFAKAIFFIFALLLYACGCVGSHMFTRNKFMCLKLNFIPNQFWMTLVANSATFLVTFHVTSLDFRRRKSLDSSNDENIQCQSCLSQK